MPGFSSTYSPLFLAVFLVISFGASYFFYRKSLLTDFKKYFLIAIKSLAIFLLLALFIEPVLSSFVNQSGDKLDIILADNSRSNLINNKESEIKNILEENKLFSNDYKVFTFSNSMNILSSADSFTGNGYQTDLSSALKNLRNNFPDRTFNSITIISDGIFNSGGNPLYEAKTIQSPFITVCIGDTIQQRDAVASGLSYNEKAFTNIPTKIKAFVNVYDYNSGSVNINLLREGNIISSKSINLTSAQQNYEVEFEVTENTGGKIKYRVEAEKKEGELTYKNNYSDFYITFIDNKVNVLVISGGPAYDDAFITSVLKRIDNYNITFRTAKTGGEFYEGNIDTKLLPELSALFLLNFPTNQTNPGIISDLADKVKTYNIPIIFLAGKNSDYQKLQVFDEVIPFNISRPGSGESLFNLQTVSSSENPLSKLNEINSTTQIFRNVSGIMPKSGAVTLATDKFSGEPVMITRTSGNFKSTAFLGYGLWRWKLNSSSNAEKTLEKFLIETINITLQKEKKSKFKVYPSKDIFDYSEQVKIYAEVTDEAYTPTRNAIVTGSILRKDGSKVSGITFTPEENKYAAYYQALPVGDYTIEAGAELNGSFYAKDNSRFSSDTLNTEYLVTKSNNSSLIELSQNTGGEYITKENYNNISSIINKTRNNLQNESTLSKALRFNLWENKYILALILLLFTVEWVMRKRNNIP
jgi:hypothetical protein